MVESGAVGVLGILPQRQACETGGIMGITVSVPLGAKKERRPLFNFGVPDGCLVADSCFDCPLPDCKPVGLLAPAQGIRPQHRRKLAVDSPTVTV